MRRSPRPNEPTGQKQTPEEPWLELRLSCSSFLTAHWLLLWLHPMGAQRFFSNLALGALTSWLLVRRLLPPRNRERTTYGVSRGKGGKVEYNAEYKIGVLEGLFLNLRVAESTTATRATATRRFSLQIITEDRWAVNLVMVLLGTAPSG